MKRKGKLRALISKADEPKVSVPMHRPVFYVKLAIYRRFKAECEKRKIPMSHVIEAFMDDFAAGRYDE